MNAAARRAAADRLRAGLAPALSVARVLSHRIGD